MIFCWILSAKNISAIIIIINSKPINKMDSFDPAINYGPNDAGISAVSIALLILGLLLGSWLIGAGYSLLTDFINKFRNKTK